MKSKRGDQQEKYDDEIQDQVQVAGDRNQEPTNRERKQDGVGKNLDEAEARVADAVRKCGARYFETEHYFTSTMVASLVAMMDG